MTAVGVGCRLPPMPYFFILPCYGLLLVALAAGAVVAWCVAEWRPASGVIVGGMVGSFGGFVVANVIVTGIGLMPAMVGSHFAPPEWVRQVAGIFAAVLLLLGPFVASAIGVAVGFAAGVGVVLRRRRCGVIPAGVVAEDR